MLFPRAHAAHHQVRMAADMLGQRHDRDVAAMRQCGKARRGGPGVVDQADRALLPRDGGQGGYVAHFHRQAAGAFQQHGAGALAEPVGERSEFERVEPARFHAVALQQPFRQRPARLIDVVGHQQHVACAQHGQQRPGDRGDAAGIKQRAGGARLQRGQRLGQRPLRRRPAAAVIELPVAVLAPGGEVRAVPVEMRARPPDRRIDHGAGPFLAAAGGNQPGRGAATS